MVAPLVYVKDRSSNGTMLVRSLSEDEEIIQLSQDVPAFLLEDQDEIWLTRSISIRYEVDLAPPDTQVLTALQQQEIEVGCTLANAQG